MTVLFDDRELTPADMEELTRSTAAALASRGVGRGRRVALMSSNRPEFVAAVSALWRLGAAVVLLSPAWRRAEIEHALALTSPSHAVGDTPALAEFMPMLHLDELSDRAGDPPAPVVPDPGDDAVLVFSSGTTGLPKAVRHTHGSFDAAVRHWVAALGLTPADRIQVATPVAHILGLLNVVTCLRTGAGMRLHRRFDIDRLVHGIETDRITVEMVVGPIASALATYPDLERVDLSSLRYVIWGATPIVPSVARTITRRTGVGVVPAYGTSELPVISCSSHADARLDGVGTAVPGVDVRIVPVDTGRPVEPGGTGEIQVRSASLMAGYLPVEANADAFDDGWFRTGDVGSCDSGGLLRIVDRLKEMIKVRGFQVAPAEVEAVLRDLPAVLDCAVFGVPDERDGESVVAAIAVSSPVGQQAVQTFVGQRLASYKVPSRVVVVPQIPRLPSGKVLRRVLRAEHGTAP